MFRLVGCGHMCSRRHAPRRAAQRRGRLPAHTAAGASRRHLACAQGQPGPRPPHFSEGPHHANAEDDGHDGLCAPRRRRRRRAVPHRQQRPGALAIEPAALTHRPVLSKAPALPLRRGKLASDRPATAGRPPLGSTAGRHHYFKAAWSTETATRPPDLRRLPAKSPARVKRGAWQHRRVSVVIFVSPAGRHGG